MNELTKYFKDLTKSVDNFHFVNHTDRDCHERNDPKKSPYLKGVNTEVCEQLFNVINKFRNCKKMNEGHFFLFFLFLFDLHNLKIEGRLRTMAHPKSELRYTSIEERRSVEELSGALSLVTIDSKPDPREAETNEGCPKEDANSDLEVDVEKPYKCDKCGMRYKRKNGLTVHLRNKHEGGNVECEICGKGFSDSTLMKKHLKMDHLCKICGNTFADLQAHESKHLTCHICEKTFDKVWKLTKHLKSHA